MARACSNLLQSPAPPSFLPFSGVVVSSRSRCPEAEGGIIPHQWCCGEGNTEVAILQLPLVYTSVGTCLPSVALPFTPSCPFYTILHNGLRRCQLAEAPPFRGKAVRAASPHPGPAQEL